MRVKKIGILEGISKNTEINTYFVEYTLEEYGDAVEYYDTLEGSYEQHYSWGDLYDHHFQITHQNEQIIINFFYYRITI